VAVTPPRLRHDHAATVRFSQPRTIRYCIKWAASSEWAYWVPHRIARDLFYSAFLSVCKDVLTATKKRRPEAARKAMGSLLSKTRGFLEHKVLRGARASAKRSLDNVAAS